MRASEIIDGERLEEWLMSLPLEAGQAIAARAALRVFPLILDEVNSEELTEHKFANLTKSMFRATFISWAARYYPAHDMKPAARAARAAAADAASAAYAAYAAYAADAARAAEAAARAAADAARAAADAADAAAYAAYVARIAGAVTNNTAAAYAAVRADGEWLEQTSGNAVRLIGQPLWHPPSNARDGYKDLQDYLAQKLVDFRQSDFIAQHPSFGLVSDWYAAILPIAGTPRSLFGEEKDILLATQGNEFWEGEDYEVMDRMAELVGWRDEYNINQGAVPDNLKMGYQYGHEKKSFKQVYTASFS